MKMFKISTLIFLMVTISYAQWISDPGLNSAVCTADDRQRDPAVINDVNGSIIIAWSDARNETVL